MIGFQYPSLYDELAEQGLVLRIPTPPVAGRVDADRAWCSQLVGAMLWFASQEGATFVWRGQSDARWPLQPRLNRYVTTQLGGTTLADIAREEREIVGWIRHQHWDRAGQPPSGQQLRFLELLAVLQHHGIPTRMLDVTRDPLVAAFFASDSRGATNTELDGAVVAIRIPDHAYVHDSTRAARATSFEAGTSFQPATAPYALYEPPGLDMRFIAQRGLFLVPNPARAMTSEGPYAPLAAIGIGIEHAKGAYTGTIDGFFTSFFREAAASRPPKSPVNVMMIIIPAQKKAALRTYLTLSGLTTDTLFPDLAGYAGSFPPC